MGMFAALRAPRTSLTLSTPAAIGSKGGAVTTARRTPSRTAFWVMFAISQARQSSTPTRKTTMRMGNTAMNSRVEIPLAFPNVRRKLRITRSPLGGQLRLESSHDTVDRVAESARIHGEDQADNECTHRDPLQCLDTLFVRSASEDSLEHYDSVALAL